MKYLLLIIFFFCCTCLCSCASAQDSSYITYQVQHDTVITTTIPEQYIPRDTTIFVDDIAHDDFLVSGYYITIGGAYAYDSVLYDTIAAHDTTFTCTLCAVHDTTVLIISAHPITIRANNQNKALGSTFTFTNNGTQLSITGGSLKVGDVISVDNSASTGASSGASSGTYAITLSSVTIMRGATDVTSTYAINYQPGTLTVAGAIPITITADDQGKVQGTTFVFTHNGTQVDVTSGTLDAGDVITVDNAASTGSGSGAGGGTYPITLSSVTIMDGATNVTGNYAITYVGGTLTVTAAPQVITVRARNQTKQYGSTFTFTGNGSQVQLVAGSLNPGDVITADNAASSGASSGAAVGSHTITLSSITIMNGATNVTGNYTITYQTGTMTVTTIPITVRANNQSKIQGTTFTFTHDGTQVSLVSGSLLSGNAITVDNAASTGAVSTALTGSYPITLSSVTIMNGATNVTSNYSITYQGGTLSVNSGPVTGIKYGIFVLNAAPYGTLQLRMDHAHYVGVPTFRYNYDYNLEQYRLQEIIDDGLNVALTWNHKKVRTGAGFPTGAEISFYAAKLDSMLKLPGGKPELLSINNEEAHREYWPIGTAASYVTWLNACVTVAHNNNVPISNGGITSGIVYSLWDWYNDRGLPDSANWVAAIWGIAGGNGTYVQEQIQWYNTLLDGFAAGNLDYVNLHWYEPERDNFSKLTTSKLLPKVVNYLRVRTGKQVLTTEIGTKNEHCPLLYEMMDEAKASGMKWIIYFAGESNERATDLSDCYKAWLAQ